MSDIEKFNFNLPQSLIAYRPVYPRHNSKLLSVNHEKLDDMLTYDLDSLINPEDILVFNDTKVINARLIARKDEKEFEILLGRWLSDNQWLAYIKKSRLLNIDDVMIFSQDFNAIIVKKSEDGDIVLQFNYANDELLAKINYYGKVPLPPYIKRIADNNDQKDYQTIYAQQYGSIASPTAGLHFTDQLMLKLKAKSINLVYVTLHVGIGTFQPIRNDIDNHIMHEEYGCISYSAADKINLCRQNGGRVICIGTTSMRLLESAADNNGIVHPYDSNTGIFIKPGYKFKIVDMLFTNFHLPKSTLFILTCAFSGTKVMQNAYNHAIKNNYRFYSYGDAMLLSKKKIIV